MLWSLFHNNNWTYVHMYLQVFWLWYRLKYLLMKFCQFFIWTWKDQWSSKYVYHNWNLTPSFKVEQDFDCALRNFDKYTVRVPMYRNNMINAFLGWIMSDIFPPCRMRGLAKGVCADRGPVSPRGKVVVLLTSNPEKHWRECRTVLIWNQGVL